MADKSAGDWAAQDWVTLWQSELTAMAADRELRETWQAMVVLWSQTATTALGMMRAGHESAQRATAAAQPAGAAAPAPSSLVRLDEVQRLHHRIAELERRLASFERNGDAG